MEVQQPELICLEAVCSSTVTENNLHVEKQATQPGVYRGIKHDAIESDKSGKLQNGVYRGVKHSA